MGWQSARIKTKRKRSSAPRPVVTNPIVEVSEPSTPSTSPPNNAGALLMQARAANGPVTLAPTSFNDSKWQSYSRQARARSKSIGKLEVNILYFTYYPSIFIGSSRNPKFPPLRFYF